MAPPPLGLLLRLKAIQAWDRLRLRLLRWRQPGLTLDARASTNLASAHYQLAKGAELRIAAGVTTERRAGALRFLLGPDARVEVEENAWLRTEIDRVVIWAGPGARIRIGRDTLLNGCHLSAKSSISVGDRTLIGFGSRLLDADQHALDDSHPEQAGPIVLGEDVWVAGDVTVLRGVQVGAHSVIGARSLVTADVPEHTLAFGVPARPRGKVGDRSQLG